MNYKYSTTDGPRIVTPQEHEYIVAGIHMGRQQFWLRNKTMMINMAFVTGVKETSEAATEKEELLRLAQSSEQNGNRILPTFKAKGMQKAINREDKKCTKCGKLHYLPSGERCLPCLNKRVLTSVHKATIL